MNHISPTRVSIYDFLYEDSLPLTGLLADISHLSLPQAKRAQTASLQALISALLCYQARHGGSAVIKKLFSRSGVKDLRQYNSMNSATISAAFSHRQTVAESIFKDSGSIATAAEYIADQIHAPPANVHILFTTLSVIFLRELAILADYAHLDGEDVDQWLQLQPQFLTKARFASTSKVRQASSEPQQKDCPELLSVVADQPPEFDKFWFELVRFSPPAANPVRSAQESMPTKDDTPHYATVIGRSRDNADQSLHDDLLAFAAMPTVWLPNQRWLLQLAKISDIYLSRKRLRIASEPKTPPSRPLVNLARLSHSDQPPVSGDSLGDANQLPPLWKNPVILLVIIVIGGLSTLALLKYQSKQAHLSQTTTLQNPALESSNSAALTHNATKDASIDH